MFCSVLIFGTMSIEEKSREVRKRCRNDVYDNWSEEHVQNINNRR